MGMSRDYFNKRRQDRRKKLIAILGGKCARCGSTNNLQFDHKKPSIKEFRISSKIDAPEKVLLKEVNKCILLCEDCHRQKTKESWDFGVNKPKHGTIWYYKSRGCRCNKCKKAMSDYLKNKKSKVKHVK